MVEGDYFDAGDLTRPKDQYGRDLLRLHPEDFVPRLPAAVVQAARPEGITTMADLVRMRPADLLLLRGVGHSTLAKLRRALAVQGLSLGGDETR